MAGKKKKGGKADGAVCSFSIVVISIKFYYVANYDSYRKKLNHQRKHHQLLSI
jgi:hypothetical protein